MTWINDRDFTFFTLEENHYQRMGEANQYSLSVRLWPVQESQLHNWLGYLASLDISHIAHKKQQNFNEYLLDLTGLNESQIRLQLSQYLSELSINYACMPLSQRVIKPRLMVFDMDSTLIQMECIDELARQCGFYEQVAQITESAMRGELDFAQSLRKRVVVLKGLPLEVITNLAQELPVTPWVPEVVQWAKQQQCKIAVVSGGFVPFVEALKQQLDLDYAFANTLENNGNQLTGQLLGDIVDGERKKQLLLSLTEQLQLSKEEVWAIGDGANDLPMMRVAGLGIAFDAKPKVRAQAHAAIHQADMTQLLSILNL